MKLNADQLAELELLARISSGAFLPEHARLVSLGYATTGKGAFGQWTRISAQGKEYLAARASRSKV